MAMYPSGNVHEILYGTYTTQLRLSTSTPTYRTSQAITGKKSHIASRVIKRDTISVLKRANEIIDEHGLSLSALDAIRSNIPHDNERCSICYCHASPSRLLPPPVAECI